MGPIQRWGRTSHKIDTTRKEMKEDHAGRIHRDKYGCSDKVNAPKNQNREFQEGYRVGASSMAYSAELVLKEEFILRIEVDDDLRQGVR